MFSFWLRLTRWVTARVPALQHWCSWKELRWWKKRGNLIRFRVRSGPASQPMGELDLSLKLGPSEGILTGTLRYSGTQVLCTDYGERFHK